MARGGIESLSTVLERAGRTRCEREAQSLCKIAERARGYRDHRLIAVAGDERRPGERRKDRNAIELGAHRCAGRRLPGALAAGECCNVGVLDHQVPRHDERGDLGITEPFEQAPDVAIDGLFPDASAAIEIAAHERPVDTRVDGRGIEGDQPAFRIADNADLRGVAAAGAEAIDGREHFLDLEADRMPAHVKGLPIDPFPPRLLALTKLRIVCLNRRPLDQRRDDQFAAALGQQPGELTVRRQPRCEAKDLFGGLPGIGHGDERR